jgi:hypothetical protein
MVVTNSYFTRSATELASAASVRLVGRRELQGYLDDHNQRIIEQFRLDGFDLSEPSTIASAIARTRSCRTVHEGLLPTYKSGCS